MADFLILGHSLSRCVPHYRGTDRVVPYHCDQLGEDHDANQAFFWYVSEGGELGVVHDLPRARWLVEAYRAVHPPQEFEIIEVTEGNAPTQCGGEFLGIDLSSAFAYSLLGWGLDSSFGSTLAASDNRIDEQIAPLVALIESFFRPRLNSNGLFNSLTDATWCCDCMMALQGMRPNLWEGEEGSDFRPLSLYRIEE